MSKFESPEEKKVREVLRKYLVIEVGEDCFYYDDQTHLEQILDDIMLRIRPYLKVQKRWMGDAI